MGSKEEALCTQDTLDVCMTGSKICISPRLARLTCACAVSSFGGKGVAPKQLQLRLTAEDGRECTFSAGTGRYSCVKGDLAYILNF